MPDCFCNNSYGNPPILDHCPSTHTKICLDRSGCLPRTTIIQYHVQYQNNYNIITNLRNSHRINIHYLIFQLVFIKVANTNLDQFLLMWIMEKYLNQNYKHCMGLKSNAIQRFGLHLRRLFNYLITHTLDRIMYVHHFHKYIR